MGVKAKSYLKIPMDLKKLRSYEKQILDFLGTAEIWLETQQYNLFFLVVVGVKLMKSIIQDELILQVQKVNLHQVIQGF